MAKLPPSLLKFSKELRQKQTPEEEILWKHLKANRFGVKFKRQVVLEKYIFDFGAKKQKLLIELNGYRHKRTQNNNNKDKIECAMKHQYTILKFWNSQINKELDKVLDKIYSETN